METSIGVTTPITVDGMEVTPSKMNDSFDIVEVIEVTPTYSFCKDAVSSLFDNEEYEPVFNDCKLLYYSTLYPIMLTKYL